MHNKNVHNQSLRDSAMIKWHLTEHWMYSKFSNIMGSGIPTSLGYVAHYYRLQQCVRHTFTGAAHFTFSYLMSSYEQLVFKWVLMDYVYVVQVKFYKYYWLAVLIIYGQRGYQVMNHKLKWFDLWGMTRPWYLWKRYSPPQRWDYDVLKNTHAKGVFSITSSNAKNTDMGVILSQTVWCGSSQHINAGQKAALCWCDLIASSGLAQCCSFSVLFPWGLKVLWR